jgi:hypothetical protein
MPLLIDIAKQSIARPMLITMMERKSINQNLRNRTFEDF